jgi:hypothetical protein
MLIIIIIYYYYYSIYMVGNDIMPSGEEKIPRSNCPWSVWLAVISLPEQFAITFDKMMMAPYLC